MRRARLGTRWATAPPHPRPSPAPRSPVTAVALPGTLATPRDGDGRGKRPARFRGGGGGAFLIARPSHPSPAVGGGSPARVRGLLLLGLLGAGGGRPAAGGHPPALRRPSRPCLPPHPSEGRKNASLSSWGRAGLWGQEASSFIVGRECSDLMGWLWMGPKMCCGELLPWQGWLSPASQGLVGTDLAWLQRARYLGLKTVSLMCNFRGLNSVYWMEREVLGNFFFCWHLLILAFLVSSDTCF